MTHPSKQFATMRGSIYSNNSQSSATMV